MPLLFFSTISFDWCNFDVFGFNTRYCGEAEWSCDTTFGDQTHTTFGCLWVRPRFGAVLRFLVWRGCRTERLVHQRRAISCRTRVPLDGHVKDPSAVGSRRRVGKISHCPDKMHRIPLHHEIIERLTNKLQTPDRVAILAGRLSGVFSGSVCSPSLGYLQIKFDSHFCNS